MSWLVLRVSFCCDRLSVATGSSLSSPMTAQNRPSRQHHLYLRVQTANSTPVVIARLDRAIQYAVMPRFSKVVTAYWMPACAGMTTVRRRAIAFSRRIASELCIDLTLFNQRAQGRPGADSHPWSACNKKARGRTTGTSRTSGLPCAMVLRLIRALPGDRLSCHRRSRARQKHRA